MSKSHQILAKMSKSQKKVIFKKKSPRRAPARLAPRLGVPNTKNQVADDTLSTRLVVPHPAKKTKIKQNPKMCLFTCLYVYIDLYTYLYVYIY